MLCMKINNFFYNSEVVLWLLSMGKKASSMQRKTKFPGILNTFFLYNNENKGNFSQQNTQKIAQIIIQDLEWMRVPPQAIYIHATIFLHITSGINKQKTCKITYIYYYNRIMRKTYWKLDNAKSACLRIDKCYVFLTM